MIVHESMNDQMASFHGIRQSIDEEWEPRDAGKQQRFYIHVNLSLMFSVLNLCDFTHLGGPLSVASPQSFRFVS